MRNPGDAGDAARVSATALNTLTIVDLPADDDEPIPSPAAHRKPTSRPLHLSHLYEDLETWYKKSFPRYEQQVQAMQYPGVTPASGTYALQPAGQSATQVTKGVKRSDSYGHSESLSVVDSTASRTKSNYGETYPAGTTIPVRGTFNTLDNPFHYTSDPTADHYSKKPAAGLRFLMFQPTIEIFNSVRLAVDGHSPDTPCFTAFNSCRHQLGLADDPPAELSGPAPSQSLFSASGVPELRLTAVRADSVRRTRTLCDR